MGKITADSRTVSELLDNRYEVDYYQREYRWEERQIAELLDDLIAKFQDSYEPGDEREAVRGYEKYFLGSVVIAERETARFIVDGQQRLTTLTLVLVELHRRQGERTDLPSRIFSQQYGKERFNIAVPERDRVMRAIYYDEAYDPAAEGDPSARNIWDRYQELGSLLMISEKQVDGSEPIAHFTDWLLHNVVLVEIVATDEEDAYTIFETMNDRGLSLSEAEMLKGYLLSRISDDGKRHEANELWRARLLELIERSKDDELDFFKAWLRARSAETIRERKKGSVNQDFDHIGSGFHKWVREAAPRLGLNSSSDFERFVFEDFDRYSKHYLRARGWGQALQEPFEAVFFNSQNNFTLQYPLLLAPVEADDRADVANRKMRMVATFLDIYIARRVINNRTLTYSATVYTMFGLMKGLRATTGLADLRQYLEARLDAMEEQFDDAAFAEFRRHQQNQRFVFNLLARMTYFVERAAAKPTSFEKYLDRSAKNRYDVEHIWPDTLDAYVERYPDRFKTREQAQHFRDRLGGLVLLPEKVNRSLQAKPFIEKRDSYLADNLLAGSLHPAAYGNNPGFTSWFAAAGLDFVPSEDFTPEALEARQLLYMGLCRLIWSRDRLAAIEGAPSQTPV
jgi:uncharacterized protein with ParB-like and HNH nuclease domain